MPTTSRCDPPLDRERFRRPPAEYGILPFWFLNGQLDPAEMRVQLQGFAAKQFNELHPNITIEFQDVPFEEMHDKLLTQVAANNPADVAYMDSSTTGDLASRDALVNLDPYIELSKAVDPDDYVEAFLMWGLIVPGAVSTYGIFLLRQYMKTIPDELLDAARIDGASDFRIYAQVALPLSVPALVAMGIFTFTYVWNDFFWPLIIISSPRLRTLQLGLALFVVKNRTVWDLVMAGSVVATLPVLCLFLAFQRYFVRGIALSGMR